ncbi:MAG: hypothetical protein JST54_11085 [Deltaproteobacteria bacterium]|nr:hypothetical protein [Deltaproteobacteria bacterium]
MTAVASPPPKSNKAFVAIVVVLGAGAVLGGVVGVWNYTRGPVVETLRAAQLAPLPRSAENVTSQAEMRNGAYQVDVKWHAPPADVDRWVKTSPSLRKLEPARPAPTTRQFSLPDSASAKAVRVTIDDAQGQVEIELSRT